MNAVANAELWHRRLGHLNKRTLDFMQRRDGNGITFDGTLADCDVCAVGKSHQLAHPKKAENADIKAPFQLEYSCNPCTAVMQYSSTSHYSDCFSLVNCAAYVWI